MPAANGWESPREGLITGVRLTIDPLSRLSSPRRALDDSVHQSVKFNAEKAYNNPPEGAMLAGDGGTQVGKFARA